MNNTSSISLIFIAAGMLFFFGKPMYADIVDLQVKQAGYEDALAKVLAINDTTKELNSKINNLSEEDKQKIETLIPDSSDMTKLIADIDTVAARYNILIDDISYAGSNADAAASPSEAKVPVSYSSALINFGFSANYDNLKIFLSDLEKSLRIIDIRSIQFSQTESGQYNYKVSAEIYWLPSDQAKTS